MKLYIELIEPVGAKPAGSILLLDYQVAHALAHDGKGTVLGFEDEAIELKQNMTSIIRETKESKPANTRKTK